MLTHIHIRDFAIIEDLDLELSAGMTALTGETGAGKSILLDALGLVLGDKADSSAIRHGAHRAEITLTVDLTQMPLAKTWLAKHELDSHDEQCLLRRVIAPQGKSKAWINGSPTTLTLLRELGEQIVDIHGQHEHQSLMRKEAQRQMLDEYGKHEALLGGLQQYWQAWKTLQERFERLTEQSQQYHERLDLLRYQVQELSTAAIAENEITQLDEELSRLANAEQLRDSAEQSFHQLYESEPSLYSGLSQILQGLNQLSRLDSKLNEPIELLNGAQIQIQEAASLLRDYMEALEIDPARLSHVESRIAEIRDLARKYRMDAQQLPNQLLILQQELATLESDDYDLDNLQQKLNQANQQYLQQAELLSKARAQAAKTLSNGVSQGMQQLGMQGGQFSIQVTLDKNRTFSAQGLDHIDFMVSANPGQPLKPLAKVASGGELSRISLAIQMIAAQSLTLPALIFDEVDTGIGGGIAEIVGQQLRQLGQTRQVLCVTHLPQVASKAHHHLRVTKIKSSHSTSTAIQQLDEQQRVDEIARMIGGIELTNASRTLSIEMLNNYPREKV